MRRSATQVNTWRECKRKFAWTYVAGIRSPQTPSQVLGDEVDSGQLQPYLRDGKPLDLATEAGQIAASGLEYLPPPKWRGLEVQKELALASPSGLFSYVGYLDLWLPFGGLPLVNDDRVVVTDFKTTKSVKSWAKTEAQLAEDVQANLYATWGMWKSGAREIRLRWLYFQTQGARKAQPTDLVVDHKHVYKQFLEIDATGLEIHNFLESVPEGLDQAAKEAFTLSVEPNPNACHLFGGCPHLHRCNLSPAQFVDAIQSPARGSVSIPEVHVNTDELRANLAARKAARLAAQTTPTTPTTPTTTAPAPASAPLGINPPEKNLPPPASASAASDPAPAPAGASTPAPAGAGRRGRPRKQPAPTAESVAEAAPIVQSAPVEPVVTVPAVVVDSSDEGTTFEITWGEECYQPADFHSFRIGPFKATGVVKAGESRGEAMRRVANALHLFAVEERANKAESFKRAAGVK